MCVNIMGGEMNQKLDTHHQPLLFHYEGEEAYGGGWQVSGVVVT